MTNMPPKTVGCESRFAMLVGVKSENQGKDIYNENQDIWVNQVRQDKRDNEQTRKENKWKFVIVEGNSKSNVNGVSGNM